MILKKILVTLVIVVCVTGTLLLLPLALAFGKSGRDTKILGKDYSMLSKNEILERLKLDFPMDKKIGLIDGERLFEIETASVGAVIDEGRMVSNVLYRRLNQGLVKYVKAFFQKRDFDLEISWNEEKVQEQIDKISSQIEKPFIPSEIVIEKGKVIIKDGQVGKVVNTDQLKSDLRQKLAKYEISEKINIPINNVGSLPTAREKINTVKLATFLIDKKIVLSWDGKSEGIERGLMLNWIGFDGGCNINKVSEYVDIFSQSVKQDPRDAVFKFENGKVTAFESAKNGYSVDKSGLTKILCGSLNEWQGSDKKEVVIEVPLIYVEPKIKTDEVNDMGIKELLGKGTSSFRHSSEIRNFNVEKGASIVNRILVAPDETFSFVKNLGEVTLDTGFKKAYIIRAGKTELDVGGGICQVSTTLFRAIIDSGLLVTQRKAHAYRVSYYEEDSKPGFDATVFIPNPDLKFINDTGHYLLIQSIYDGKNKRLTYEIYGTSDGRKTEISNYRQWDAAPAPPDVWIDDPTLPPGKVIKDESRVPGLKASFEWKVTRDGEILHQKTFVSSYVPWAAVYRRGPIQ